MGKKKARKGDDDDWEAEAEALAVLNSAPPPQEDQQIDQAQQQPLLAQTPEKKLSKKELKKRDKHATYEKAVAEMAASGAQPRGDDDDDDDDCDKPPPPPTSAAGKKAPKKGQRSGSLLDDEPELEPDLDFGRKKGKKKKNRGGDDSDDDESKMPPPLGADDSELGVGKKKKGAKSKRAAATAAADGGDIVPTSKFVAELLEVGPHPDPKAKKLAVCLVDAGEGAGVVSVVCGATNLREGMMTVLAPLGSAVATPSGEAMAIKPATIRGAESQGMLCGRGELGLVALGEPFPTEVVELDEGDHAVGSIFEPSMLATTGGEDGGSGDGVGGVEDGAEAPFEARSAGADASSIEAWLATAAAPLAVEAARGAAEALAANSNGGLDALIDDCPSAADMVDRLGLKRGHAALIAQVLQREIVKRGMTPAASELSKALGCAGLPEDAAHEGGISLAASGLANSSALEDAVALGSLGSHKLRELGLKRGHAMLVARNLGAVEFLSVPVYDWGRSRKRRRGPDGLTFPSDAELPLFTFFAAPPEPETSAVAAAAAEAAVADVSDDDELGLKPKKKKKPKADDTPPLVLAAAADDDDEVSFDFGAKPKKKKAASKATTAEEEEEDESGVAFDFGGIAAASGGGEEVSKPEKKKKKKKKKDGDFDEEEGGDFSFELAAAPRGGDKVERKSAEQLEIEAMMAELETTGPVTDFSIASVGQAQEGEGEGGEADFDDDGNDVGVTTSSKKGKKDKKKKKKKSGGDGDAAADDDEDALLEAAMMEAAVLRGDEGDAVSSKKEKKKKKKKKGGGGDDDDDNANDDEDALLEAAMAERAAVAADGGEAKVEGDGDDDDGGAAGAGGELTANQKKKLKAKARKEKEAAAAAAAGGGEEGSESPSKKDKSESEKKKKPKGGIAAALRAQQEARAREEKILEVSAELTEEAQRLHKNLEVVRQGEKALRKLDSAVVAEDLAVLRNRSEAAVVEFEDHERLVKVRDAVAELCLAMDAHLVLEEKRRIRREKEKERKERLKVEGKLLSKAERERQAKQQAYLSSLGSRAAGAGEEEGGEDAPKKRVVYGSRKRPPKPSDGSGGQSEAVEPTDAVAAPAMSTDEADAAAAEEADEVCIDDVNAASADDEDWDAVEDLDGKVAGLAAGDEESDEEDFVIATSGLSSKLAALADSTKTKERADQVLDKLYNFDAASPQSKKEDDDGSSEDDSDDSDSSDDDEMEALVAEARAERERRLEAAMAARTPERLRNPICCIMGHVDTGKTKLLDNIRRTNVQDGEAGGITQQIGASFFPAETLRERMGSLVESKKIVVKVPGVMIIDTPGHESFSNLRSRGSSLCDIAILVIDIMHGLEPQTIESLHMLRGKKTPFVIALNKVDRLYGWQSVKDRPFVDAIGVQPETVQREFEDRAAGVLLALAEQGLNAQLYYRNKDFREYVSLCPTSAHTGEGVPDILMLLVQLSQKLMVDRIMWTPFVQCTVLEVKVVEGLGATADVILANGTLHRGDRLVMCGFGGPVVTRVRELLTPRPLREIRIKTDYLHHQEIDGAAGIKICANHLESVVAGSACLVPLADVPHDIEVCKEDVMVDLNKLAKAASEVNGGLGVYAMASTLGSLEALLEFLKTSKIPVSSVNIGPIHKKDIIKASIMHEHKSEYATILAFDVPLSAEAAHYAKELNVKVFTAAIIYHLFDQFTQYMAEVRKAQQAAAMTTAVFPCICEVSSPEHVYCRGGGGDPIIVGLLVKEGTLKRGTPLCVERRGQKDPTTGLQAYLDIGRISSIEKDRKPVDEAKAGQAVACKIDAVTSILFGRQFDHTYPLYSRVSRKSIDAIKDFFKEDLSKEDWQLLIRLKKMYGVL